MMEFMLMCQPVAEVVFGFLVTMFVLATIVFVVVTIIGFVADPERHTDKVTFTVAHKMRVQAQKTMLWGFIAMVPVVTLSKSWDIFKNVIIYRAITSDTADKAIQNGNLLMDKIHETIEAWDPEAISEKVDKVVEVVEGE